MRYPFRNWLLTLKKEGKKIGKHHGTEIRQKRVADGLEIRKEKSRHRRKGDIVAGIAHVKQH